jgi:hypothetical protein
MAALNLHRANFHGEWNYTIQPNSPETENQAVIL